jgi:hypothetical protein
MKVMSQLHLVGGEKGGVGKSLLSRVLAQYFIDRGLPFSGFDTDRSHGALLRFYANYASPIVIDRYETLDQVMEPAADSDQPNSDQRILVDLAAQTHAFLSRWIEDSGVLELANDLDLTLTYWHVMDSGRDSVDLLRKLLDQFGGRLQLILVLNEVRGEQFDILNTSGQRERAEALGARIMRLRRLSDATLQKIDEHSVSFWAATQSSNPFGKHLGLLERQRVKLWLQRSYEQLDALGVGQSKPHKSPEIAVTAPAAIEEQNA